MEDSTQEARHGFVTYKNYLVGFSYLLNLLHQDYYSIANNLEKIRFSKDADLERIRKLLFNSWNSETLLNLPRFLNKDFIKFIDVSSGYNYHKRVLLNCIKNWFF